MKTKRTLKQMLFKQLMVLILVVGIVTAGTGTLWNNELTPLNLIEVQAATSANQSRMADKINDVTKDAWYMNSLTDLILAGGISGVKADYKDGTLDFAPQSQTTVAQFITLLTRAMGYKITASGGEWYSPYIAAAKANGIILNGETYEPNAVIRRADMCKFMVRALKVTPQAGLSNPFSDVNGNTEEGRYILTAYAKGLMSGYPDKTFKPNGGATRAEMAQTLWSTLKATMSDEVFKLYIAELERQYALQPKDYRLKTQADDPKWTTEMYKKYAGTTYLISSYANTTPAMLAMPELGDTEREMLASFGYPDYQEGKGQSISTEVLYKSAGGDWMNEMVRRAKGYEEAYENIDYRIIEKTKIAEIQGYTSIDYTVDGKTLTEYLTNGLIAKTIQNKTVQKAYFWSDGNCVYQANDGTLRVRGIIYYKVTSGGSGKYVQNQVYADYVEVYLNLPNATHEPSPYIKKTLKADVKIDTVPAHVAKALQ